MIENSEVDTVRPCEEALTKDLANVANNIQAERDVGLERQLSFDVNQSLKTSRNVSLCEICGIAMQSMTVAESSRHMKIHDSRPDKSVECYFCEKKFKSKKHLGNHVNDVHTNINVNCNECHRKFSNKKT